MVTIDKKIKAGICYISHGRESIVVIQSKYQCIPFDKSECETKRTQLENSDLPKMV